MAAFAGILFGAAIVYVAQISLTRWQIILLVAIGIALAAQIKLPKKTRRIW